MLGTDGDGWRYLHFPQFCGADVRIYKQAPIKYPKIEIIPDPFDSKRKVIYYFVNNTIYVLCHVCLKLCIGWPC